MKRHPAPKTPQFIVDNVRQMAADGATYEEMLMKMRNHGLSIAPSILLLSDVSGMPRNEAKGVAHLSETWRDWLDYDDAVHDAAIEAAKISGAHVVEREAEPLLQLVAK